MKADQIYRRPLAPTPAEQPRIGAPLFHAAWLFAAGILIARFVWLRPAWLLLSLVPLSVLCVIAGLRAQRIIWIPAGVMWCVLGVWCAEMQPQPAPDPTLAALSDGLMRTVEGTVIGVGPVRSDSSPDLESAANEGPMQRVDLRLSSVEIVSDSEDVQSPASGVVRMNIRWPSETTAPAAFSCGQRIRADARLLLPNIYRDPGAWNYRDYLLEQGITSTASIKADRLTPLESSGESIWKCRLEAWQHSASARLLTLPSAMSKFPKVLRLTDEDAVMLAAMVTGDRTYLTHSLREGFERTGSFHMLVVSGLHLGIVAASIFWTTRKLRLPQIPSTLITIGASFAYALFTGFATPVQRALWMVSLYLMGRLIFRQRNVLNTIGFASLCLLAASPRSFFESSLQMTILAVVSIGGVAAPVLERTIEPYIGATRDLRSVALDIKLPPREAQFRVTLRMFATGLASAISKSFGWKLLPWTISALLRSLSAIVVCCIVELAMTLPMATYFHRITVFALPVNLIILPLLVILVPSALVTLLLNLCSPVAGAIAAGLTALLLHLGVGLIHLFAAIRTGDFRIPGPTPAETAAFCILIGASLLLARAGNLARHNWFRPAACVAMLLAAVVVVLPRRVERAHNALLIEALDVGQGDSLLLITPEGKTILVDGGGFGGDPRRVSQNFDIGEEVVSPALWSRGIRHLDVVALSHAHSDHMSGLTAVLRNFKPDELWVGNNPPSPPYLDLLKEARDLGTRVRTMRAGDRTALGSVDVHVLAPSVDYKPGPEPENNDSLILRVSHGVNSILLEGDAEGSIERELLAEPSLQSTLLKVGHHGSATSTQPEFLARVSPRFAIISCGLHNHYGHPRREVLEALQASHIKTLSTDINGASCLTLNGANTIAEPFCGMQTR